MFTSKLKLVTRMRLSRSPRRSFRIKNGRVGGVAGSECKNDEDGNVVVQLDKFTLVGLPVAEMFLISALIIVVTTSMATYSTTK